jgi:dipicolinate synthase subunit A
VRGDKRYEYLSRSLREMGYDVYEFDADKERPLNDNNDNIIYIFPPAAKLTAEDAESLAGASKVFAFTQSSEVTDVFDKKGICFFNVFNEEKFAYKNALITADGALMLVAQNTEIIFSDMKILVVGFGRVGKALSKIFKAVEARVDVLTFDRGECAAAVLLSDEQYGSFENVKFDTYDVVINTVPARLINRHVIAKFKEGVFLLELASDPGGFDKDAVYKNGINFLYAKGLPAKVAPASSSKILLDEIISYLDL